MMYPFTDILKPGPISRGRLEKSARRATDLELMDERRELSSEMPSPVEEAFAAAEVAAGASGSVGEDL